MPANRGTAFATNSFQRNSRMKKKTRSEDDDPLDREFDFSEGRPNPYWLGVVDRECVRLIEKDLAEMFPDNQSVNAALRTIADAAARAKRTKVSARRASLMKKSKA
jgi:hypothetical protein